MAAPLWTHDQKHVAGAPVGSRIDSGTRLYFYDLNGPHNVSGKIAGAPHGMMWSATGPMAMQNGENIDGTARWVEGYERVSLLRHERGFRHVRVDLRSFDVPCRVLVWGGRPDHGGTGARWLVLARGLTYRPTRLRKSAEHARELAHREHEWMTRASTDEYYERLCNRLFAEDKPSKSQSPGTRPLVETGKLVPTLHPYETPHEITWDTWRAQYQQQPTLPDMARTWGAGLTPYQRAMIERQSVVSAGCPACAEMDGWGCREHQK